MTISALSEAYGRVRAYSKEYVPAHGCPEKNCGEPGGPQCPLCEEAVAARALADAVLAEQASGALPIDADWLRGLAAETEHHAWVGDTFWFSPGDWLALRLEPLKSGGWVAMLNDRRACEVRTRGQLLALLAGLRGGA